MLALLTGLGAGPLLLQLLLLAGQGGVPLVVVLLVPRHGLVHLGLVGLLVCLADLLPGLGDVGHPLLAGELLDELRVKHLLAEQRVGGAGRFLRSAHVFV